MFCANCGKEIPAAAHFCPSCRRPVEAEAVRPTAVPFSGAAAATSATPTKKKMALWKKIALGVVGFIVVVVVIALWATSGVIEPIDRQLAALKSGDLQAAYAETSTGFRDAVSFEKFEAFVKQYPALSRNASHSFSSRSTNASGSGEVKGTLTDDRGAVLPVQYQLVKENGAWKILGLHIGPEKE
jgi:hypothetical protein